MQTYTMVVRHGIGKDSLTGFTLVSSDYQTVRVDVKEMAQALAQKKVNVNNLQYVGGSWKSTNGSLDNYTLVNDQTGAVEGAARAVILDRAETNGKLSGYTVFTQAGTIVNMSIADAVMLANNKMLSNGKVRHTDSGDIVSAIGGNYPLRELKSIEDAPKGKTSVEIMFFGDTLIGEISAEVASVDYFGAIVSCTSAVEMTRLIEKLSRSNAAVIGQIVGTAGQAARESLKVKRMGANSIYGVFKLADLKTFIEKKANITSKTGDSVMVSVMTYAKDKSGGTEDQAIYLVSKDKKVVVKEEAKKESINDAARKYSARVAEIIQKF